MNQVIIIGAGPAGLAAGIYTGRARLNPLILEKGAVGGQILLTDNIENYPGFPDGIPPLELIEKIKKQAERFGAQIKIDEVIKIEKEDKFWKVIGYNQEYLTKTVIIATGSRYRNLGLPNEDKLTGKGVSYCATCDGAFFRDREVVVVGGGDNALTEALFLTRFCKKIYLVHRRNEFRAEKILQERVLKNEKIEVIWDAVIEEIIGEERVNEVKIKNLRENKIYLKEIDGLFIAIGTMPNTQFVKDFIDLDKNEYIEVTHSMETFQPGIFAAGDVTSICPQQMAAAVGSGVIAALSVDHYLSYK
ncbi:MAG: thioredoxin-disulfide reductase [Candidatus Aminicenantia bacterium]